MAEQLTTEPAQIEMPAVSYRDNIHETMQPITTDANMSGKNRLTGDSGIEQGHARHNDMRLVPVNCVHRCQLAMQQRVKRIKPESPKVYPVPYYLDLQCPNGLSACPIAEGDQVSGDPLSHRQAGLHREIALLHRGSAERARPESSAVTRLQIHARVSLAIGLSRLLEINVGATIVVRTPITMSEIRIE